jgi:glycerophosphoryl diester phosphodiesterase
MVLNIAHRGARSLAPENTLAAAQKALEAGADMWEIDVSVSRDGVLVLFHDDSLSRTTDAQTVFPKRSPWIFTTFQYEELLRLDAGSWFEKTDPFGQIAAGAVSQKDLAAYHNERIPTLEEALIFSCSQNLRINIELKRLPPPMDDFPVVERVLQLIDKHKIDPRHFVLSSFNHGWLKKIGRLRPDIDVQAVIGRWQDRPLEWGDLAFKTYNARYTLLQMPKIKELVQKGLHLNVWAVNEANVMRRFIECGVTGIMTDFPQTLTQLLNSKEDGI